MSRSRYNPLAAIPSASVIREKLAEAKERVRQLTVLLETAEKIEGSQGESDPTRFATGRTEVAHA